MGPGRHKKTAADFWALVDVRPDGCWLWKGPSRPHPRWCLDGERMHARWAAWALVRGQVPDQRLRSRCPEPLCINPDHAGPVLTRADVREAIASHRRGTSWPRIAERLGVTREQLIRRASGYLSRKTRWT